jgi:xyloglucan-specific exo-beta-1,4-glucanase
LILITGKYGFVVHATISHNSARLYGTGATIYGGHDLLNWDSEHLVTLKSLATGIEETAVLALISPPGGPPLLSAVGDIGGFSHSSLDTAPAQAFHNPTYGSTYDLDYAGNTPADIVRTGSSSTAIQIALSYDFGVSWSPDYGASTSTGPGKVAISADGDTVLLQSNASSPLVSKYTATFSLVPTLPSGAAIASDKRNNSVFYGGSGSR